METTHAPTGTVAAGPAPRSQPRLFDYLFLWIGMGVSAFLADLSGLRTVHDGPTAVGMQTLLRILPTLLFLPVGIVLFWPIFYTTQVVTGRAQGLSAGEWLLGLAWLGALAFAGWCIGKGLGNLPLVMVDDDFKKYAVLGYILFMVSMGTLALVIWLIGLIGRWQQPWTHTLSLALMIWPAAPLLIIWLGDIKME